MNLPNIESDFWRLWQVVVAYIPEEHVDAAWAAYKAEYFHGQGLLGDEKAERMAEYKEFAARLRKEAQDYAQAASERAEKHAKPMTIEIECDSGPVITGDVSKLPPPTDPWGEATDTRGYPEK